MEFQKIAFLLGGKFPTSKAYGITTRETINVLVKDSYDVRIFCYKSLYHDPDFDSVSSFITHYKLHYISRYLRKIALSGNSRFNSVLFRLVLFVDLLGNISQIKRFKPEVIWTREPLYAFICLISLKHVKVILEVHEVSNVLFYKILNRFLHRVMFCPINESNLTFLKKIFNKPFEFELSPMGISDNLAAPYDEVKNFVKRVKSLRANKLKIAYVGKLRPTTYSKGIEDLILLAKFLQNNGCNMEVILLGAMKEDIKFFGQLIQDIKIDRNYLQIKAHVPHSLALASLKKFDVLVLPSYLDSKYIGMPLKMLEYLATGRIVIFGESQLYKDMIPEKLRTFSYAPHNINDLYESILTALNHEQLVDIIIEGVEFAKTLTWKNRTRKIISRVS